MLPVKSEGLEITPTFGNRFNVTMNPLTTRIAVGEFVAGDPNQDSHFHTVLVMPTADALALANVITSLFSENPAAQQLQSAMSQASSVAASSSPKA